MLLTVVFADKEEPIHAESIESLKSADSQAIVPRSLKHPVSSLQSEPGLLIKVLVSLCLKLCSAHTPVGISQPKA